MITGIPWVDAAVTIGGLVLPSAVDFLKKKFIPTENETPERTLATLATTAPEHIPTYLNGLTGWLKAQIEYFNRDVLGTPSTWVVNLRAAIRPAGVILAFVVLGVMAVCYIACAAKMVQLEQIGIVSETLTGIRLTCEGIVSSWFGDRIRIRG